MKAIETHYAGHLFRSRLEARWAAFFDLVGWEWTYEPFDTGGYIPDFVLHLHEPCAVEVKPFFTLGELAAEATRVIPHLQRVGWRGELLTLGASPTVVQPRQQNWSVGLGCHDEGLFYGEMDGWVGSAKPTDSHAVPIEESLGEAAVLATCPECRRITFFNDLMSYHCRLCGWHGGDSICSHDFSSDPRSAWHRSAARINTFWGQAHEATRWKP